MADGPKYKVSFRRRREERTDYRARRKMMESSRKRMVTRLSNKHVRVQIIESLLDGDKVHVSAFTKELGKYGWIGAKSNIPSAYLVGYLIGKRAVKAGLDEAIFDIGLQSSLRGRKIFAVLKGAIDAGMKIPHEESPKSDEIPSIFPPEDRLTGKHIEDYAKDLSKTDKKKFERIFSEELKNKFDPTKISELFKKTKAQIDSQEG